MGDGRFFSENAFIAKKNTIKYNFTNNQLQKYAIIVKIIAMSKDVNSNIFFGGFIYYGKC